MIRLFTIGLLVLCAAQVQAQSSEVTNTLSNINDEIINTEVLSLTCLQGAQQTGGIISDCLDASQNVSAIDNQLMQLMDILTSELADLGQQFSVAMVTIKQYRIRLQRINDNLGRARAITGVYNWTNKIAPSFYLQQIYPSF